MSMRMPGRLSHATDRLQPPPEPKRRAGTLVRVPAPGPALVERYFFFAAGFFAAAPAAGHTPLASFGAVAGVMTASLNPLSAVMRAFFEALILIVSPVEGLRPVRAGRSTFANFA